MTDDINAQEVEQLDETVYQENGYENRRDYLDSLADEYGNNVYAIASLLGPSEDFDGLISMLDDGM